MLAWFLWLIVTLFVTPSEGGNVAEENMVVLGSVQLQSLGELIAVFSAGIGGFALLYLKDVCCAQTFTARPDSRASLPLPVELQL